MASSVNPLPTPYGEPLIVLRDRRKFPKFSDADPEEGQINQRWLEYMDNQATAQATATARIAAVDLTDQVASIAATDMSNGALASGFYEVLIFASVVQAATVSSSLTVGIDCTDRAQTKTIPGTAVTGNTTGTTLVAVVPIHIDNASPVRYTVTYASVGATSMKYDLHLVLRRVNA